MHKASATCPGVFRQAVGDHGDVAEIRQIGGPVFAKLVHVQIARAAATPVKSDRAGRLQMRPVLDDRLDRRKAGARGQ